MSSRTQTPVRNVYNHHSLEIKTNFKQSFLRTSPEKTAIFKGLLDAFKLNRFEPNFKISFLLTSKLSIWMSNLKFSQLVLYLMFNQLFDWRLDPQFEWLSINWLGNVQPNFIDTFEISLKSFPKLSKFHLINSSKNTLELGPPQG